MSEKVKLIIEIPKYDYEEVGHLVADGIFDYNGVIATVCKAIVNGTPLDDVKAEIETDLSWNMYDDYGNETSLHKALIEILYNIDDESEEE